MKDTFFVSDDMELGVTVKTVESWTLQEKLENSDNLNSYDEKERKVMNPEA